MPRRTGSKTHKGLPWPDAPPARAAPWSNLRWGTVLGVVLFGGAAVVEVGPGADDVGRLGAVAARGAGALELGALGPADAFGGPATAWTAAAAFTRPEQLDPHETE